MLHQKAKTYLGATGLETVKEGSAEGMSCYTPSEFLAAVWGRYLAGTDREGSCK